MAKRKYTIADLGRELQGFGWTVKEHPEFGGVTGGHRPNSYHHYGEAIDVTWHKNDEHSWHEGQKARTWQELTGDLNWRKKKSGLFHENLGPGDDGHPTHVHTALRGTIEATPQQVQWLATGRWQNEKGELFDSNPFAEITQNLSGTTPSLSTSAPAETIKAEVPDWLLAAQAENRVSDPGDSRYWQRADIKQWEGANKELAQKLRNQHGALAGNRVV